MKIALLAKGKSLSDFLGAGYEEVWGLNQLAQTHELDRLFVMDDLEERLPFYNGPEFPEWLKSYPKPFFTSRAYPEWPTAVEFPLVTVCRSLGFPMGVAMYSTTDYMLAYAIYVGATQIDLYGVDCIDPKLEQMRTSIAFWIGAAMSRGIRVTARKGSHFRYWTDGGIAIERGCYGYVDRPRIETLVRDAA